VNQVERLPVNEAENNDKKKSGMHCATNSYYHISQLRLLRPNIPVITKSLCPQCHVLLSLQERNRYHERNGTRGMFSITYIKLLKYVEPTGLQVAQTENF
jgi:hypothetical protein